LRTQKGKSNSPTLKDVANIAGISAMTVSRTLNSPEKVSHKTLIRVQEAIKAVGYIPNQVAGSLASSKSKLIAVVVPQINNSMFVDTVGELSKQLELRGYHILLCVSGFCSISEEHIVSTVLSRRPEGIVLIGVHHTNELKHILYNAKIPVVELWDSTPTPIDILVGFSHEKIGRKIAQLLIKQSYKDIGLIWTRDQRAGKRKLGLVEILSHHKIQFIETVVDMPTTVASGRQGLRQLLENKPNFDAIVCATDTLAQGCVIEAKALGYHIPEQLSVIGFGNLEPSSSFIPSITTVDVDRHRIGLEAATLLVNKIEGDIGEPIVVDIGFSVIHRDSTFDTVTNIRLSN